MPKNSNITLVGKTMFSSNVNKYAYEHLIFFFFFESQDENKQCLILSQKILCVCMHVWISVSSVFQVAILRYADQYKEINHTANLSRYT